METTPILIVADRLDNLIMGEALLDGPDLQLEIFQAESVKDAQVKMLEQEFALILIDGQMFSTDGCEAIRVLGDSRSENIPIILVIADGMVADPLFKGCHPGRVDYLFKPVEPHLLRSKVGTFLELHNQRLELAAKTRELDAKILELEVLQKELEEKNERLEVLSSLDELTGLFNRRYFDDNLLKEWRQALRTHTPLSLIFIDIDRFREYSDRYGYLEADDCLCKVAQGLYQAILRPNDIVARYGGEKFAAILPNTDRQGAEMVALRMIEHVTGLEIPHQDGPAGKVTVSIGTTSMVPSGELTVAMLADHASKALRAAKQVGRDALRAKFYPDP